jgi:arginine decarboxylase
LTQINSKQSGSNTQASSADLVSAIKHLRQTELVSFHTPGHKGYATSAEAIVDDLRAEQRSPRGLELENHPWMFDVTELPGLDELAQPSGVLSMLEQRAARLWGVEESLLSVNGASAALMAAVCACASRGSKVLIPQNVHRSVIQALVISGLTPVWYSPNWDQEWQYWGSVNTTAFEDVLKKHAGDLACALVVSPNYAGTFSDIETLSLLCHQHGVPLIVDEAHGAHLLPGSSMPPSAVTQGADIVVHSLHKTLSALTQTGLLHRLAHCPIDAATLRGCLNLLQSSSPSYLLMSSIEQALVALEKPGHLDRIEAANRSLHMWLHDNFSTYSQDPAHILIRLPALTGAELYDQCCALGIYPETVIGNGVLLLLSPHTTTTHIDCLLTMLSSIAERYKSAGAEAAAGKVLSGRKSGTNAEATMSPINTYEQDISPRQAFFGRTETVALAQSVGRIAAECLAPCPPGNPVLIPGQRVTAEVLSLCGSKSELRVVVEVDARSIDQQTCKQNPRKRFRASDARQTQGEN